MSHPESVPTNQPTTEPVVTQETQTQTQTTSNDSEPSWFTSFRETMDTRLSALENRSLNDPTGEAKEEVTEAREEVDDLELPEERVPRRSHPLFFRLGRR